MEEGCFLREMKREFSEGWERRIASDADVTESGRLRVQGRFETSANDETIKQNPKDLTVFYSMKIKAEH